MVAFLKKRKPLLAVLVLALVVAVTYFVSWMQYYSRSQTYYRQAMANYDAGDYIGALKGKQVSTADGSGYAFQGGMQEVIDIWSSGYAFPKPAVYHQAVQMANTIIDQKIDAKTGLDAFQQYFKTDNEFLPQILFKVAGELEQQNDIKDARDIYQTIKDAFPYDKASAAKAGQKLAALPAAQS